MFYIKFMCQKWNETAPTHLNSATRISLVSLGHASTKQRCVLKVSEEQA